MNKNQKIILYGGIGVFACLIALIIVLIVRNSNNTATDNADLQEVERLQWELDSLRQINDQMEIASLTDEFDRLNAEVAQYEDKQVTLANDSLVKQYNEAKNKVTNLMKELEQQKKANKLDKETIKQLQAEIGTLKDIARHYLEEIKRLNEENQGLRQEVTQVKEQNENLTRQNSEYTRENTQLSETVKLAKKLNITSLSLKPLNKKDKDEKKISKAKQLDVSFVVSPNATAAPGNKQFFVRILSPDGELLGGGPSFTYDGKSLGSTASRTLEYNNTEQLPVHIYWTNNASLTTGNYVVEVFCDGYRLGSGTFNMAK